MLPRHGVAKHSVREEQLAAAPAIGWLRQTCYNRRPENKAHGAQDTRHISQIDECSSTTQQSHPDAQLV